MSFELSFHAEAAAELECVVGDYEARTPGLGYRFRAEAERIFVEISGNPLLFNLRARGHRRANLRGFSYYIAFVTDESLVIVLAVAHSSRDSAYFRHRFP